MGAVCAGLSPHLTLYTRFPSRCPHSTSQLTPKNVFSAELNLDTAYDTPYSLNGDNNQEETMHKQGFLSHTVRKDV